MQSLLGRVFREHAARTAVQGHSTTWTYAELDQLSAALAQALLDRGVTPGQALPILMGRSPLLVLSQLALLRLGGTYSPIDMASPAPRRRAMLDAIGNTLRLTDGAPDAEAGDEGAQRFDVAAWLRSPDARRKAADLWIEPPADCPAYVMFTSGSTGVPKGVMVPHAGIVRLVRDANYAHFGPEQRWGFISSPAFDLSTLEVWGALLNGGCCVIQETAVPSLDALGEFLIGQRITDTWLTSALFNAMVEDQLPSLGQLRQLLVGGERVSAQHARLMLQAHPGVCLINGYGPTENTTFTLCHTIGLADTEGAAGVPIGTPLTGTQVRVEPTDAGVPDKGELWTSGDGVALGYLGDAALTQEKFVWRDGTRWYRTGDLVRERADGVFEFHGRIDRQIKLRGQRIELEEVELALTRCPGIGNGAVLVVGERAEQRRIVAVYSLLETDGPGAADLAAQMRLSLPEAAIPSEFVCLPQLPKNLSGKVDRKALAALFASDAAPGATTRSPLLDRLQHFATEYPERIALESDLDELSYAALMQRSAVLAAALRTQGVQAGDRVALFLPRSTGFVIALLACVRVGAAYAPIDLASPGARIAAMLDVLKPRLALVDSRADTGAAPAHDALDLATIDWNAEPAPWPSASAPSPDAPACIFFTSGSTGVPKAVMTPASGIDRLVRDDEHAHFGLEQRWGFLSSPAFDAATLEIWGALLNGGTCVVQEDDEPSLQALGRFFVERRISDAWLTAGLFNAMVQDQLPTLGGLNQLLIGGERVSPTHAALMLEAHPGVRLINGYGPTENTTFTLCHTITLADTRAPRGVPIGRPVPDTQVRIEPNDPAHADEGELWAAGAGVALGYFGDAELTRERFVERDGVRWYRSGDSVRRRADGVFEFIGRRDRQVKLQGHRVEIDEVELALAGCAGVGDVAVLLCGDDAASRHLVAFYGGLDGAPPAIDAVAAQLAARLPDAAMPKAFRPMASLPVNLNGKVDRDALARLMATPPAADASTTTQPSAATDAGLDEGEAALAALWRTLLPHAQLRPDSHFLRVGGTSLLALHLAALVRKRLGRQLSPVEVLRHPVLADQARLVAQASAAPAGHDTTAAQFADWDIPLTRAQRNVLAATRLDPTGSAYLVHVALYAPSPTPDAGAWRHAFEQLAQRHPALRLQAQHDGHDAHARLQEALSPGWWQQYPPRATAPRDLDWPHDLLDHVNRPLDTARDGSMRVDCWPVQSGGLLLVWTLHHHVIDEAGIATALAELDALLQGRALQPVYGSPFAFQAIECAWADPAPATAAWADRLTQTLAGQTPPLAPAPAAGHERRLALDAALQARLAACCSALGCTPFPLLLSAYGLAVQDAFGAPFRFVSTPFSRRAEPELLEPIGYLLDVRFIEAGALPAEPLAQTLGRVVRAVNHAQKQSFQSLDDLIVEVAARDPQVAQCLTQFGFTWRLDPAGELSMAGQRVQHMRVPQVGARYSLCLHVAQLGDTIGCSIEAVASAHEGGQVDTLWAAFVRRLDALCALREVVLHDDAVPSTEASPLSVPDEALRGTWARWLKAREGDVKPDSHFLRSGGSSLTAMRMAAELRREHGLKLDVGAFLAEPTFSKLGALARSVSTARPEGYVLLGPAEFTRVMVLIPGSGGQAAGMYALADELHRRLPRGTAVAVVDLDEALQSAPADDPLWFVSRRLVQIVRDLGQTRVMGIVGFSMGGSLALRTVEELGAGVAIPVWMLDTFAPRAQRNDLWTKIERSLAARLFGGRAQSSESADAASSHASSLQSLPLRASPAQWHLLGEQLAQHSSAAPGSQVRLIQARQSMHNSGLIWQRRNNGFVPGDYASWAVHEIDGAHLDIPRHLAASTADIIVDNGQFHESEPDRR